MLKVTGGPVGLVTRNKIDVVNGWRGYAIVAVLIVHSFARMPPSELGPLEYVLKSGWAGVNAFFIASGFVLYLPYASGRRTMLSWSDAWSFLKHRAARLVPLCFIGSFVAFVMFDPPPVTGGKFWAYVVNFPLATFSWIQGINVLNGNGALWSISVEIVLSAIFPLIVLAAFRFGLARVFVAVAVVWLAHRILLAYPAINFIPGLQAFIGLGWFGMFYGDVVGISLVEFLLGMGLAALHANGGGSTFLKQSAAALFAVGLLICCIFFTLFWNTYGAGFDLHSPTKLSDALLPPILHAGLALMFVGILWARINSLLWRAFKSWPIQILGLMCYSLYIWHPPLLSKLGNPLGETAMIYSATLLAILIFSVASYRYIEFPTRRIADLFLFTWRPSSSGSAAAIDRQAGSSQEQMTHH